MATVPSRDLCAGKKRLPLTRTGVHGGPVMRRAGDLFGSTVNVAARIAALSEPGQLLATGPVAEEAMTLGIEAGNLGRTALRSVAEEVPLWKSRWRPQQTPHGSIRYAKCTPST